MAPEWDASDVHNVTICALFYNDLWTAESSTARREAASEFRMHRRDLGLTPLDRRRLEWSIETADAAKDRGRQRRGDSPRERLKITGLEHQNSSRDAVHASSRPRTLVADESASGDGA
jgi:hypothetical protein